MNRRKAHAAMRKAGLRPVTIWVPDTRRAGFAVECRRQSLLLRGDAHEHKLPNQLSAVADTEGWK